MLVVMVKAYSEVACESLGFERRVGTLCLLKHFLKLLPFFSIKDFIVRGKRKISTIWFSGVGVLLSVNAE